MKTKVEERMGTNEEVKVPAAQLLEQFVKDNNILMFPNPVWVRRDDNTFSLVVNLEVRYKDKVNG